MSVTKKTKPAADYHQWSASELSDGDILDIFTSLGNREADSVTIESLSGPSTLRFNVVKKIHKEYCAGHNPMFEVIGVLGPGPRVVAEIEEEKDDIVIEQDATQTWIGDEMRVRDIKIVTKAAGLKITVT